MRNKILSKEKLIVVIIVGIVSIIYYVAFEPSKGRWIANPIKYDSKIEKPKLDESPKQLFNSNTSK
tara:strand:+ start:293 stop:490 length:198 start_codon:yes stop_codon:yes gene_type:complete